MILAKLTNSDIRRFSTSTWTEATEVYWVSCQTCRSWTCSTPGICDTLAAGEHVTDEVAYEIQIILHVINIDTRRYSLEHD